MIIFKEEHLIKMKSTVYRRSIETRRAKSFWVSRPHPQTRSYSNLLLAEVSKIGINTVQKLGGSADIAAALLGYV